VAVSGQLILVSGLGSVVGPLIGAILMARFEIDGVLYFMATAVLLLAPVAGLGRVMAPTPRRLKPTFEILTPQAGPLAHDPLGFSGEPS
jgi:MFS family permease